ncbi:MAG: PorT family protein [Chitinophagaceae bacterium]|nr:PorT family protein [Chitinophagaceae bacterium]
MKQLVVSAVLLVIANLAAFSQISYGPKLGFNFAKIAMSNKNYQTSLKPGLNLGGFVNYKINTNVSVQGELGYSMEGTKEKIKSQPGLPGNSQVPSGPESPSEGARASGQISTSYLHIPILARYTAPSGFYGEAGPQIGFLLGAKEKWRGVKSDIKPFYKSTEFRFPIGIGYHLLNANLPGLLSVNARYAFGFSPFNNRAVGGGDLKTRVFSIGVQYNMAK